MLDGDRVSDVRCGQHVGPRRAVAARSPPASAVLSLTLPRVPSWLLLGLAIGVGVNLKVSAIIYLLPAFAARLEEAWIWVRPSRLLRRRGCRRRSVPLLLEHLVGRVSLLAPGRSRTGRQARGVAGRARVDDRSGSSDVRDGPLRGRARRFRRRHVSRARDRLDGRLDSAGHQAWHRRLSLPAVRAFDHVRGVRRSEAGPADARPGACSRRSCSSLLCRYQCG